MKWFSFRRWIRFWWQRRTRGWDDATVWSLDGTIAAFILPRLKRFKEINKCYPPDLTPEKWNEILDKMILAMEFYSSENRFASNKESYEKADEGIKLFAEWFIHLWY